MFRGNNIFIVLILIAVLSWGIDKFYLSHFVKELEAINKELVLTENKLATAKIVEENLNHVRDLVFKNMVFDTRKETVTAESEFFKFITTCVNDLKLELLSIKPARPQKKGRITTISYDIELKGDFFSLGELFAKFENSRRIITIESFDAALTSKNDGGSAYRNRKGKEISVSMQVHTYQISKS